MYKLNLFIIIIFIWSGNCGAACTSETWKISPGLPLREIKKELDRIPRQRVLQLAWGEMLRKDINVSMSVPLLQYLEGTEQNPTRRGYFKILILSILPKLSSNDALRTWPLRPHEQRATHWQLKDLCALYESTNK